MFAIESDYTNGKLKKLYWSKSEVTQWFAGSRTHHLPSCPCPLPHCSLLSNLSQHLLDQFGFPYIWSSIVIRRNKLRCSKNTECIWDISVLPPAESRGLSRHQKPAAVKIQFKSLSQVYTPSTESGISHNKFVHLLIGLCGGVDVCLGSIMQLWL